MLHNNFLSKYIKINMTGLYRFFAKVRLRRKASFFYRVGRDFFILSYLFSSLEKRGESFSPDLNSSPRPSKGPFCYALRQITVYKKRVFFSEDRGHRCMFGGGGGDLWTYAADYIS